MAAVSSQLNWMSELIETVLWSATWLGILVAWLAWAAVKFGGLWAARQRDLRKERSGARHAAWQITIPILALTLVLPGLASAQGWWWGSPVNPGFERSTVIRVSGTVRSVSFNARSGPASLDLECPRNTYTVILGPAWYLAQVRPDIREGDPLTIEGSKMMDRRGRLHLVAAWVKNERTGVVLKLRDEAGRPLWMSGPRPERMTR